VTLACLFARGRPRDVPRSHYFSAAVCELHHRRWRRFRPPIAAGGNGHCVSARFAGFDHL